MTSRAHTRDLASRTALTAAQRPIGDFFSRRYFAALRLTMLALMSLVLTFGAPILRSASLFEEDRTETSARMEAAPIKAAANTDLRHRLPDFLPSSGCERLVVVAPCLGTVRCRPFGYSPTGPPLSRAPPTLT